MKNIPLEHSVRWVCILLLVAIFVLDIFEISFPYSEYLLIICVILLLFGQFRDGKKRNSIGQPGLAKCKQAKGQAQVAGITDYEGNGKPIILAC